jgi:hypothetical protein
LTRSWRTTERKGKDIRYLNNKYSVIGHIGVWLLSAERPAKAKVCRATASCERQVSREFVYLYSAGIVLWAFSNNSTICDCWQAQSITKQREKRRAFAICAMAKGWL